MSEMIVANGNLIALDIKSCIFNNRIGKWDIVFKNGHSFSYNRNNVVILKNPIRLNPNSYQISHNGRILDNITKIEQFSGLGTHFLRIYYANGNAKDYRADELNITRSALDNENSNTVFEYLREVANCISVYTEDDIAILTKQYNNINYLGEDSAAAIYLNPSNSDAVTDLDAYAPIFPFGCNESQFNAVTNALENRISVIEGPPGTGKTQTILNIIANLVLQGKTVQVVSNNNSAIDNIVEKLASDTYNMDFMAARLGSSSCKEAFVRAQSGVYPDLSSWESEEYSSDSFFESVRKKSQVLRDIFKDKNRLAELKQERYSIQLEQEHLSTLSLDNSVEITRKELSSEKILEFLQEYQDIQDGLKSAGLIYRLIRKLFQGISVKKLLKEDSSSVINSLQNVFYVTRLKEVDSEIDTISEKLRSTYANSLISELTSDSLHCFRAYLAEKYEYDKDRRIFDSNELWQKPFEFTSEYPVVLSTTYTARSSLGKHAQFDYVIMDEASQVDVATGLLALSCAKNAVIVGDTKQLPNVVNKEQKLQLTEVFKNYKIPKAYDYVEYSFLSSICSLLGDSLPRVILLEHYRCHPQIIGFCNQKFYNNELLVMADDKDKTALQLMTTAAGNHARDRMNQRQIDVIRNEILPTLKYSKDQIGIIAPYRNQVNQLKKQIADEEIDVDTVHKFQGREKDVIILSTVDDVVTEFSDDPNLLNVAVSRAKKQLIIVASEQDQPAGSNVGDLIGYIRYNNCDIKHSAISSVFDYLYSHYQESRIQYLKKHKRISEYDSENLMYAVIMDVLKERNNSTLGVVCHQPLQLLFSDQTRMSKEEQRFVNTGLSHLDFLIFSKVSKKPVLAIEVDGYSYHKEGTRQAERDALKNNILAEYEIPLLRFSTNGSSEKQRLTDKLDELCPEMEYSYKVSPNQ